MTSAGGTSTILTLMIAAAVVVRFLIRELQPRTIRARTLWIRPAILVTLTVLMVVAAFSIPGVRIALVALALVVGSLLGAVTGALVVAATRFAPAGERGAVRASGSVITVAIWMAALALRLGARYAFAGLGATAAVQFELNIGLLTLVSAAFVVVAVAFRRAIVRFAPT